MNPEVSIVIPLYNEELNVPDLFAGLVPVIRQLGMPVEVLAVDDGSRDGSVQALQEARKSLPQLKIVRLRRNFGQHAATFAGFALARGRIIVSMDADLQNDPADIPHLIAKLEEGFDVVGGARRSRQDSFVRRKLPSMLINRFISARTGLVQTDTGCFLKAYTKTAAMEIAERTEPGGFFTATIGYLGLRYAEVSVRHHKRSRGQSRYDVFTQLNMFMSLFTGYARRPFQAIEIIGAIALAGGVAAAAAALAGLLPGTGVHLLLYLLTALFGLTLGTLGIIGEFAVRIYYAARKNPRYLIAEVIE